MPLLRFHVLAAALLVACGGSGSERSSSPAPSPPAEPAPTPAPVVFAPEEIPEVVRCEADDDCVATQFSDCCALSDGTCPCEWHAVNREDLERRQLECAAEECTDGACPTCPESEPPGSPRCIDHYCQLRSESAEVVDRARGHAVMP